MAIGKWKSRHTDREKRKALILASSVGIKNAAAQFRVNPATLYLWRKQRNGHVKDNGASNKKTLISAAQYLSERVQQLLVENKFLREGWAAKSAELDAVRKIADSIPEPFKT